MASLSETEHPFAVLEQWLAKARQSGLWRNPNAMALATVGVDSQPSVRMVLLKEVEADAGYVVFYTHYNSRKGVELAHNNRAAGSLHWDAFGRQIRLEGRVLASPATESDAYFASRPLASQLNAWSSEQSQPVNDPSEIDRRAAQKARELGLMQPEDGTSTVRASHSAASSDHGSPETSIPRPPAWGGYRLWCSALELWIEGDGRFHERLRYERSLAANEDGSGYQSGPWHSQYLQP